MGAAAPRLAMNPESTRYLRPTELSAALAALSSCPRVILAGGTDLYATGTPQPERLRAPILDISAIEPLRSVRLEARQLMLGATVSWASVRDASWPPWLRALQQCAAQVGGEQVQNVATIAGNLCNASPAADGVPPLLALSARLELASAKGRRMIDLEEFVLGARRTALRSDELVTAVHIPARSPAARSAFYKLGARSSLVISIVSLALSFDFDAQDRICYAGLAVGSCAARAQRLHALESRLVGLDRATAAALEVPPLSELTPIDDVRGSAAYRREAVAVLVRRGLRELCRG